MYNSKRGEALDLSAAKYVIRFLSCIYTYKSITYVIHTIRNSCICIEIYVFAVDNFSDVNIIVQ